MAKGKRRGGRVTPKGCLLPYLRAVGNPSFDGSPLDQIIDSGGRELLGEDDPIAAETWASAILDVFDRARLEARLEGMDVPPFEEEMLRRCRQRGDRGAAAVAAALDQGSPMRLPRPAPRNQRRSATAPQDVIA